MTNAELDMLSLANCLESDTVQLDGVNEETGGILYRTAFGEGEL